MRLVDLAWDSTLGYVENTGHPYDCLFSFDHVKWGNEVGVMLREDVLRGIFQRAPANTDLTFHCGDKTS